MKTSEKKHLTPHFTLYELVRSGTALEHDINNTPSASQVEALTALARNVLEPLRQRFGPVVVSSGFRSPMVNLLVKGAPTSQHMYGEAADIVINTRERGLTFFQWIKENLDFDQLIWEPMGSTHPRWLHVSYTRRHKNRHQILGKA